MSHERGYRTTDTGAERISLGSNRSVSSSPRLPMPLTSFFHPSRTSEMSRGQPSMGLITSSIVFLVRFFTTWPSSWMRWSPSISRAPEPSAASYAAWNSLSRIRLRGEFEVWSSRVLAHLAGHVSRTSAAN
eukprot:scaffold659639_cov43-Prasinocladus_malaysianus.AAC.1